jgi:hypothetical protein
MWSVRASDVTFFATIPIFNPALDIMQLENLWRTSRDAGSSGSVVNKHESNGKGPARKHNEGFAVESHAFRTSAPRSEWSPSRSGNFNFGKNLSVSVGSEPGWLHSPSRCFENKNRSPFWESSSGRSPRSRLIWVCLISLVYEWHAAKSN